MFILGDAFGEDYFTLAGAVKFNENESLPFAENKLSLFNRYGNAGANEGGENVVANMGGIVRVAMVEPGDHFIKSIKHVEVGAGIEVSGCESGGGVF